MTEFEDIQRLVRLKRYEMPPEGFVDDFVTSFHHRQRAELLNQTARSLFWERLMTFFEGRPVANMAVAGTAVIALVAALAIGQPGGRIELAKADEVSPLALDAGLLVDSMTPYAFGSEVTSDQNGNLSPLLLSKHFAGGYADEARAGFAEPAQQRQIAPLEVMPGLIFTEQEEK